jgi:Zn ribbon nucleic-acid-binding protein
MIKWHLKSCPRCRGDLFIDEMMKYRNGITEEVCLQCGHRQEINRPALNNDKPYRTLRKYARI